MPILVVDDDDDILNMTSYVLKQLGYRVATASDGAKGIDAIRSERIMPCLILLDLMMPVMDGAAFRRKLLEIPEAKDVPIVILSGDDELAAKAAGMRVGGFEGKPISVARLAELAAKYCSPAG